MLNPNLWLLEHRLSSAKWRQWSREKIRLLEIPLSQSHMCRKKARLWAQMCGSIIVTNPDIWQHCLSLWRRSLDFKGWKHVKCYFLILWHWLIKIFTWILKIITSSVSEESLSELIMNHYQFCFHFLSKMFFCFHFFNNEIVKNHYISEESLSELIMNHYQFCFYFLNKYDIHTMIKYYSQKSGIVIKSISCTLSV